MAEGGESGIGNTLGCRPPTSDPIYFITPVLVTCSCRSVALEQVHVRVYTLVRLIQQEHVLPMFSGAARTAQTNAA